MMFMMMNLIIILCALHLLFRYVDDKFIFFIDGSALNTTGAIIPEEPMYLLFNTAVSSTWGFPWNPNCQGKVCYDCHRWECACWVPMGMCENLPATYSIDYVRVYQRDGYVILKLIIIVVFIIMLMHLHHAT